MKKALSSCALLRFFVIDNFQQCLPYGFQSVFINITDIIAKGMVIRKKTASVSVVPDNIHAGNVGPFIYVQMIVGYFSYLSTHKIISIANVERGTPDFLSW